MREFWERAVTAAIQAGSTAHCAVAFADVAVRALAERVGSLGSEDRDFLAAAAQAAR